MRNARSESCDELLHFRRVDEGVQLAGFELLALFIQMEELGMRPEEDIAGHLPQFGEAVFVVGDDVGICGVVDQLVDDAGAAVEDDLVRLAGLGNGHGPGGAALGVAGREVRGQGDAA